MDNNDEQQKILNYKKSSFRRKLMIKNEQKVISQYIQMPVDIKRQKLLLEMETNKQLIEMDSNKGEQIHEKREIKENIFDCCLIDLEIEKNNFKGGV